ncbi:hypothetical protein SKAU_G00269240 [Synaphobranchus kaupii]|uniref:Uncharacterized protein n=1 Tax=Synaphobranchus kaupii TaxID=118154 RepID=A0A9Q1F061_SYNKA|nr:hypothetical protein SKAU_G00269240 [Synaphobranchus kaupii]
MKTFWLSAICSQVLLPSSETRAQLGSSFNTTKHQCSWGAGKPFQHWSAAVCAKNWETISALQLWTESAYHSSASPGFPLRRCHYLLTLQAGDKVRARDRTWHFSGLVPPSLSEQVSSKA